MLTATGCRYDELKQRLSWRLAESELGYHHGANANIGYLCTDRICALGGGNLIALLWEDHPGTTKSYSFNDLRMLTDSVVRGLRELGAEPRDRVCLIMDRIPSLNLSFLGILKMGAIVQPLFSAFGKQSLQIRLENSAASFVITQKK